MNPIKSLLDWLTADEEQSLPAVDTQHVLNECERCTHMTAGDDGGGWCRCNLCGEMYRLEEFPELVDHVAGHDEQGAAEIDPFDRTQPATVLTEGLMGEVEEWRKENIDEVDA